MIIEIECLFAPGCGSRDDTLQLVEMVARRMSLVPTTREILVKSLDDAKKYRFLGSPSLRVNGRDIEPGAEGRTDFGLG